MAKISETEYRFDSKPFDVVVRPFHRVRSPSYDRAVDERAGGTPAELAPLKRLPSGRARESGARNATDFVDSGLTKEILEEVLETGLTALAATVPVLVAIDKAIKAITNKSPIEEVAKAIAEALAKGIEGALFERFMRAFPSWVPVGRKGYGPTFVYTEDGTSRTADREEEREIEGALSASYQLVNDIPLTQWTRYARWSFHVRPLPGYRWLIGPGNAAFPAAESLPDHEERENPNDPLNTGVVDIYKAPVGRPDNTAAERGALECLWDVGAFSNPFFEGRTHGVMFHENWPYWPMAGDHFWAVGRWGYDCMRPLPQATTVLGPDGKTPEPLELFPTVIHACKAFATARFEGFKFPENRHGVPAVRFFFFSGSEGGYVDNHETTDRDGGTHDSPGFRLTDRDYEFIVDLPPREGGRTPFPIGHTTEFMRNTIVLRPRLLMNVRFAPFAASSNAPPFRPNTKFHRLVPRVELIRPADPNQLPSQVKVTVPMTELPKVGADPEVYAFDLSLGWHDPTGADASKLKRVRVAINDLKFHRQGGKMRLKTAVNGRWHSITANVRKEGFDQDEFFSTPASQSPTHRVVELFLPEEARLLIHTHGTWLHGFGEKLEDNSLQSRKLRFGGLIPIPQEMQDTLDALKKLVAAGQSLSPDQQATLEEIESFLKRLEQFIGVNKDVEWLLDIDAERDKQDREVEKQRVSILARELWVKLLPLFNVQNVPMGWYTFLNVEASSHAREHGGSLLHSGTDCGLVSQLVAKRQELGGPIPVKCHTRQWESVGSGNLLGERARGDDPDYTFSMFLDVSDQLVSS